MSDSTPVDRLWVGAALAGMLVGGAGVEAAVPAPVTDASAIAYFAALLACFLGCLSFPFEALYDAVRAFAPLALLPFLAYTGLRWAPVASLLPAGGHLELLGVPLVGGAAAGTLGGSVAALAALAVTTLVDGRRRRPPVEEGLFGDDLDR